MKTSQLCQSLFVSMMLICASVPLMSPTSLALNKTNKNLEENWAFNTWYHGHLPLYKLPLSELEQRFSAQFPGHIARFTDGSTVWVIRHTVKPTRMLHSSIDCYKGLGYKITQPRVLENAQHQRWRCFNASKGQHLQVCERIVDQQGKQWTDVSAWYWENTFKQKAHAWWAITQVTRLNHT